MDTKKHGLLITGCGRSGTGFMAKIFEAVGVLSGHEVLFSPLQSAWPHGWVGVESSWLAAPFLAQLPSHVHVVHQVRHPFDVIRSFMKYGFFEQPDDYANFCYRHVSSIHEWQDPLDRCIQYWISWNEMIEQRGVPWHRVEDLSAVQLVKMAEVAGLGISEHVFEAALKKWVTIRVGHSDPPPRRSVTSQEFLSRPLGPRLKELAGRYGYVINE